MSKFAAIEQEVINNIINPEGFRVPIEFFTKSVQDSLQSKEQGRPVYVEKTFIKHYISKLSVHVAEATEEDFQKYAKQYEAFKNNKKQREDGIPVGMLPAITQAEIDNLEACKVYTIERLASAPEGILHYIGQGARGLQQRANAYLQQSSSAQVELKAQAQRIAELEAKLKEKENEPSNDGAERSGRNNAVRATNNSNRKRQQGNEASA